MAEYRFFEEGTIPEYTTAEWYADRERAPHLEQPIHHGRLTMTQSFVELLLRESLHTTVVDLGAGDGGLLQLISKSAPRSWGYDLQPSNIEGAISRGVDVRLKNVFDPGVEWGEIAVATEMLEHLLNPHSFVRRISLYSRAIVASSPNGETPDNHYEYHTWGWDMDGYRKLIEGAGFTVVAHETVDHFQVIAGKR